VSAAEPTPITVVFDIGGVLLDWDPRYLYRRLLPEAEVDAFLDEIGFAEWNHRQDAGRPWAEAVMELAARHPHHRELIAAYPEHYWDTVSGPVPGSVEILHELHDRGTRLLALTNWSAETFPQARERYPFLGIFDGVVVSGEEGIAKPDLEIFRRLRTRHDVPLGTAYVDDAPANVAAAAEAGLDAILFTGADDLRLQLRQRRLLV
jgi:2-haloacid dehalogenase